MYKIFMMLLSVIIINIYDHAYSQEVLHRSDYIISYDSISIVNGDSIIIPIVKNTKIDIEILGDTTEVEDLLKEPVSTDNWKVYKNLRYGILFYYPPNNKVTQQKIKQYSGRIDTFLLVVDNNYSAKELSDEFNSGILLSMQFGKYSFSESAEDAGFGISEGCWYTQGRAPLQATYIKGSNWAGLIGENAYGTEINGSFGLAYNQISFAYKNLAPNYSAIFDFDGSQLRTVIAIISSLQLTDQLHHSVCDWKKNVLNGKSKNLLIRIDKTVKGLRYVCWSKGRSKSEKPDLLLYNGIELLKDSYFNHRWIFVNNEWTYIIEEVEAGSHIEQQYLFLRLIHNGIEKQKIKLTRTN